MRLVGLFVGCIIWDWDLEIVSEGWLIIVL